MVGGRTMNERGEAYRHVQAAARELKATILDKDPTVIWICG